LQRIATLISLEEVSGRTTMIFNRPLAYVDSEHVFFDVDRPIVIGYALHESSDGSVSSFPYHSIEGQETVVVLPSGLVSTPSPSLSPSTFPPSTSPSISVLLSLHHLLLRSKRSLMGR